MLNILTNGDSFTHECHLPKESRWTNLLGVTCNIALGAGSNDRIFFTTVEYLNHNNPDVLIIGWTSWVRSFLYTTCGDRYVICGDSAFKEDIGIISNSNDISKIYYNNFFNEFVQYKNTLEYMLHIQNYCFYKKIKLIYFCSITRPKDFSDKIFMKKIASQALMNKSNKEIELQGVKYNLNLLDKLISKLEKNIWVNDTKFFCMQDYCKNYLLPDGHVNASGSFNWFSLIKSHL